MLAKHDLFIKEKKRDLGNKSKNGENKKKKQEKTESLESLSDK